MIYFLIGCLVLGIALVIGRRNVNRLLSSEPDQTLWVFALTAAGAFILCFWPVYILSKVFQVWAKYSRK